MIGRRLLPGDAGQFTGTDYYGRTEAGELIGPYESFGELNLELACSDLGIDRLPSYQVGQAWYGWVDEDTPLLRVFLYIPLAMLEPNSLGCNVLPDWDRHFCRSAVSS